MWVVLVSGHPPLLLAPASLDTSTATGLRCHVHAALWLSVAVDQWQLRRTGHLHLLRERDGAEWREVDLTRHPLRQAVGEQGMDPDRVAGELLRYLEAVPLRLHRVASLGVVSEVGETAEEFRRRASAMLRPELQRRIAALSGEPLPRLPWRRRAAERRTAREKARLAAELGTIVAGVEAIELGSIASHVRRAEIGWLLLAPGVRLDPPRHRGLMIETK